METFVYDLKVKKSSRIEIILIRAYPKQKMSRLRIICNVRVCQCVMWLVEVKSKEI